MGFAEMPLAMSVPGLTPVERLVLTSVAEHSRRSEGWTMFWGQKRMAARLNVSDRAVRNAYVRLEDLGLITRTKRTRGEGENRRRTTDLVRFNVDAVRRAVDAELSSSTSGSEFRRSAELSSAHNKEGEQGSEHASAELSSASRQSPPPAGDDDGWNNDDWHITDQPPPTDHSASHYDWSA